MMIYVDRLVRRGRTVFGKPIDTCYLFTDGARDELHRFAQALGVRGDMQIGPYPRYELTAAWRERALERGAVDVPAGSGVRISREGRTDQ